MNSTSSTNTATNLSTFLIVAGCSIFFSSKGVFIKLAYDAGADSITVLALRMAIALPFFILTGWLTSRNREKLSLKTWARLAVLGFVGYYVASFLNFQGLRFISVGLERIVLFVYPSLILLGGALFFRRKLSLISISAVLVAYLGIFVSFASEAHGKGSASETALGVGLVLGSALCYAVFITLSADLARQIGGLRLASIAVGFSCLYMLIHFSLVHDWSILSTLPNSVFSYGALLAILGTVVPSLLMGIGLKRAGATNFAIIGTVGPIATVVLAWFLLEESLNSRQIAGLALSLAGGLAVSLQKSKCPND